jgi:hypothetical protein
MAESAWVDRVPDDQTGSRHWRPATSDDSNTERYWNLALAIDIIHMPLVIALVILGMTWFSGTVFFTIVTVLVILQIAMLSCPVMALTGWLKRKHDPTYENRWSVTYWLYERYGRVVGIGVFAFFVAASLAVRALFF